MTLSVHIIGGGLCVKTLDWSVETFGGGGGVTLVYFNQSRLFQTSNF